MPRNEWQSKGNNNYAQKDYQYQNSGRNRGNRGGRRQYNDYGNDEHEQYFYSTSRSQSQRQKRPQKQRQVQFDKNKPPIKNTSREEEKKEIDSKFTKKEKATDFGQDMLSGHEFNCQQFKQKDNRKFFGILSDKMPQTLNIDIEDVITNSLSNTNMTPDEKTALTRKISSQTHFAMAKQINETLDIKDQLDMQAYKKKNELKPHTPVGVSQLVQNTGRFINDEGEYLLEYPVAEYHTQLMQGLFKCNQTMTNEQFQALCTNLDIEQPDAFRQTIVLQTQHNFVAPTAGLARIQGLKRTAEIALTRRMKDVPWAHFRLEGYEKAGKLFDNYYDLPTTFANVATNGQELNIAQADNIYTALNTLGRFMMYVRCMKGQNLTAMEYLIIQCYLFPSNMNSENRVFNDGISYMIPAQNAETSPFNIQRMANYICASYASSDFVFYNKVAKLDEFKPNNQGQQSQLTFRRNDHLTQAVLTPQAMWKLGSVEQFTMGYSVRSVLEATESNFQWEVVRKDVNIKDFSEQLKIN